MSYKSALGPPLSPEICTDSFLSHPPSNPAPGLFPLSGDLCCQYSAILQILLELSTEMRISVNDYNGNTSVSVISLIWFNAQNDIF